MPTPEQTDRAIKKDGETVTLSRKRSGVAAVTWTVTAFVRGYQAEEIANDVQVGDRRVTISALEAQRHAIPDGPVHLDDLLRDDRTGKVQQVELLKGPGGLPDRYVLRVRGLA